MFVKHLTLASFRNYETAELKLEPGINLIMGPNGQGKTNLVEAIRYLSTLNSHRVAGYLPLIKAGTDQAIVRCLVSHGDREVMVELELNRDTKNAARMGRSPVPRIRDIVGVIQSVTFAPEDIDIIRRDPTNRRAFLDELVTQYRPRHQNQRIGAFNPRRLGCLAGAVRQRDRCGTHRSGNHAAAPPA